MSGLCASRGYILIIDENRREQSEAYQRKLGEIAAAIGVENIAVVHSHSMEEQTEQIHYDTEQPSFDAAMDRLLEIMDRFLRKEHQVPPDESRVVWFDSLDGTAGTFYMTPRVMLWTGPMKAAMIRGTVLPLTACRLPSPAVFSSAAPKKGNIVGVGCAA